MATFITAHLYAEIALSDQIPPFAKIIGITIFAVLASKFLLQKRPVDALRDAPNRSAATVCKLRNPADFSVMQKNVSETFQSNSQENRE